MAFHGSVIATRVNTAGLYPHGPPDRMDVVIPSLQMGKLRHGVLKQLARTPRAELHIVVGLAVWSTGRFFLLLPAPSYRSEKGLVQGRQMRVAMPMS